jgi:hypothetical protein
MGVLSLLVSASIIARIAERQLARKPSGAPLNFNKNSCQRLIGKHWQLLIL